jgi:hypothetical protein
MRCLSTCAFHSTGILLIAGFLWCAFPNATLGGITLYTSTATGRHSGIPGKIYSIDLDTGEVRLVAEAPAGLESSSRLAALDFDRNGVLYVVTGGSIGPAFLLNVDVTTGEVQIVGEIPLIPSEPSDPDADVQGVGAIAFDADGTLYGTQWDESIGNGKLITVNPTNAQLLSERETFGATGNNWVPGLAFSSDGQLFGSRGDSGGHEEDLVRVAKAIGELTPIGEATAIISDLWFSPDGQLFGSSPDGHLFLVDPVTGAKTIVLTTGLRMSGLTGLSDLCGNGVPRSQGYWHRQCLGIPAGEGGIDPGRNGRGPSEPIEPNFQNVLMPEVDLELQNRLFLFGGTCQDGMDADPPSDQCQKAIKQYTALLLNVESGKLQNGCTVDVSAEGCGSTNVGDLLNELAGLILGGDCNRAADCAGAVNEGTALESLTVFDEVASASDAPEPSTIPVAKAHSVGTPRSTHQGQDSAAQLVQPSVSTESPLMIWDPGADVDADADTDAVVEPSAPVDDDPVGAIRRHLAVLDDPTAPESAWAVSTDALLTALSGGYELGVRVQIVKALLGRVDAAYNSLLAEHLHAIHREAADFEKEDLAREAKQLLKRLKNDEQ